ncbi:MAG TPA: GTPase HflX [Clostridiales bacterium]|nr:MAG: GTPase HflX [Firmicutes bacterium ADurb.Bin262]HOU09585.1 GTPase HflX [Clostridiales bacterium]HQH62022.1 GTPase HflX [Clostridiales bacterium]HQK72569.1 GTPase HflX [Clostridiales bacterium]
MQLHENKTTPEVALLVGIDTGAYDCAVSLDELEELAHTAGAQVAAKISQSREKPDAGTCVGAGKLEEIVEFCENNEVDLLIFDCELTPVQQRNLEDKTGLRVIDRTTLILDIFAAHALSNEGKLQVELAQLKYRLPRLTGKGAELSRLGGGIGTRGPGETKLETDRRHIRRQIKNLETQLEALGKRRSLARARRSKEGFETVAIVGYTNAGKSTLMNTLTQAGVLVEDKLFATLDPAARALVLPDGRRVMLVDTVGLIRRLPHNLVEAFKSTLEEAVNATVILNVCDVSSPECAEHLAVTEKLLEELGCGGKPVISVLNKCDLLPSAADLPVIGKSVIISALEGKGIGKLLEAVSAALPATQRKAELLIPYAAAAAAAEIRRDGIIYREEYREDGLYLSVSADFRLLERLKEYLV